jgi:hypothetical protein
MKGMATLETTANSRQTAAVGQGVAAAGNQAEPLVQTRAELNWYLRLLCGIGLHRGEWKYLADENCSQMRVCERCGMAGWRMKHQRQWEYVREESCAQQKTCRRCGDIGRERERHVWGATESHGAENVRWCERCHAEQRWTQSG